jgi:hypothetical protein
VGIKRVMVTLVNDAGMAEDSIVNTWHFDASTTAEAARDALTNFYNPASGTKVSQWFSNRISRSNTKNTIKVYDLDDPEPREATTYGLSLAPASSTTNDLPHEVALCLSYYHDRNLKRQRGRIYLGPFHHGAVTTGTSTADVRPSQTMVDSIKLAAEILIDDIPANWVVYSPTDNVGRTVTNGWIDNSWDTQRRRGASPTVRTQFS